MAERFTTHEIKKTGNLYFLINSFIGAYNRRTEVMAAERADQQRINELTRQLKAANDLLESNLKPKELNRG